MKKKFVEKNGKLSRIYPEKKCENPDCINNGHFIPRRSNHKYCIPKCGEIYNNDRRKSINNSTYKNEKELRRIDKFLHDVYRLHANKEGYCCVHRSVFDNNNMNVYMTLDVNLLDDKKTRVHSTYRYLYHPHQSDPDHYVIIKK